MPKYKSVVITSSYPFRRKLFKEIRQENLGFRYLIVSI